VAAPLLVPMQLQALLVNPNVRAQGFQRWTMDYSALAAFASPEPAPFAGLDPRWATDPANDGIHLHWTLPPALRRGSHDPATGATNYPLVPNRWLVVRYSGPAASAVPVQRSAAGWIVESDYLGADGLSAYLDPAAPAPTPLRLGRALPLNGWREPAPHPPFLTAIAPGNIAFASYQPYGAGVFSFHDPLAGVAEGQVLSYLVAGWYSDAAADVLAPARQPAGLAARLAELGWAVQGAEAATSTLFHGAIRGLTYSRTAVGARPAAAAVAVGNSSIDAMTALIRQQAAARPGTSVNPNLLEAFQYDLLRTLDGIDGPVELSTRIHEAWFAAQPGGSFWQVVSAPPDPPGKPPRPARPGSAQDGAPIAQPPWVADLNRAQAGYDAATRELAAMRRDLYELWWKRNRANALPQRPPGPTDAQYAAALDAARPDSLAGQVLAKIKQVADAQKAVPWGATQDALAASIAAYTRRVRLDPGTELKRSELPAFRAAADPVVVIAGVRMEAFDDDLGANAAGLLPCRFADQTVGGLALPPPPRDASGGVVMIIQDQQHQTFSPPPARPVPITAARVGQYLPALSLGTLNPVIGQLSTELFFLDPVNAAALLEAALLGFARLSRPAGAGVAPAQMLLYLAQVMAAGRETLGTAPAILPQAWTQPWAPLFLEWEVAYHPIRYEGSWQFDGANYTSARPDPDGGPIRLAGRSLLTPQPSFTVKARLDAYLATSPDADLSALESFVASVDGWDFLSQALSGFNSQLTLRDSVSMRAPDAKAAVAPGTTMADLAGSGGAAMPMASGAAAAGAQPVADSGFQWLRSGQFTFTRVSVVDRFGQSVDVVTAANAASFAPVVAEGLAPQKALVAAGKPAGPFVQLPPRLLQSARLDARFLPPDLRPVPPNFDPNAPGAFDPGAANPICGWIVPNPLDQALACYDPDGAMLGEAAATAAPGGGSQVSWLPAPGSPAGRISALSGRYAVLGAFLRGVVNAGPAAFADLLKTIDATLWTIDPPGGGDETYLAAVTGRPLALVRAAVRGVLSGPLPADPAWQRTLGPPPPPQLPRLTFPVRIGDALLRGDGLVGYCAEPDFGSFRAAYRPAGLTSRYVVAIDETTYLKVRFDAADSANVTLLLDPRAPVHIVSDILPASTLSLPRRFVTDALAAMSVTVRLGPILTDLLEPAAPAPPAVVLPRPPQVHGTWQWAEAEAENAPPSVFEVSPADAAARFPGSAPTVRFGWLKLTGGLTPPAG
jgi:hypothetical protein